MLPRTNARRHLMLAAAGFAVTTSWGGCFLLPKEDRILAPPLIEPAPITYRTVTAQLGTIERRITVSGSFIFPTQIALRFGARGGRLSALHTALGESVVAGQLLAELDTDSLRLDIARQQLRVERAQVTSDRLNAARADRYQIRIAEIDVQLERLLLEQQQTELAKADLRSPIDGEVVYIARLSPGEVVDARLIMMQVADPADLVLAYRGPRVREFRLGSIVSVNARGTEYAGEVVMTPLNVPSDAPQDMRDLILIRADISAEAVSKGQSAVATLVVERREQVIVLPIDVVQSYANRQFAFVLEDGLRTERTIETGIATPTSIEVRAGLRVGEQVVIR